MKHLFLLMMALPLTMSAKKQGKPFIDSLVSTLPAVEEDTNKAQMLNDIAYAYHIVAPDSGLVYAQKAMALSHQLHWQWGIAIATNSLAVNHQAKGDQKAALAGYNKALSLFTEQNSPQSIASTQVNIANVYADQGDRANALSHYFKALTTIELTNNQQRVAMVLDNIGSIYFDERDYQKARKYYETAQTLYTSVGDTLNMARTTANLGLVLSASGNNEAALRHLFPALETHKKLGNAKSAISVLTAIGETYDNLGEYQNALLYKNEALSLSREIGGEIQLAVCTGNIGASLFKSGMAKTGPEKNMDLKKATDYLATGANMCRTIGHPAAFIEFSIQLAKAYASIGQYKKAFEVTAEYLTVKDSVFAAGNKVEIAQLEANKELAIKNKDLQMKNDEVLLTELHVAEKRSDQLMYTVSILLIILGSGMAFLMFNQYRKNEPIRGEESLPNILATERSKYDQHTQHKAASKHKSLLTEIEDTEPQSHK
ncbi:tetratricopeptide repeat protein [Polluticoccus soli]|uniref:tetratricopeptide repeat protein n=1 Tax=Polluticoccus soli TaxID=3034150 RepID=UPI0023E31880|nr:tetratricopeptide repeat protein [Flavipsychrobacter sp. JY13-12]